MFCFLLVVLAQTDPNQTTALTVSPAAAPVPALKYELLPRGSEKHPGNAAVGYYQAALNRPAWPKDADKAKKQNEMDEKFRSVPIEELSGRELTEYLKPYQTTFKVADYAARYDRCDWQRENQLSGEGLFSMLPDIQQHRELARMLDLRVRLAAVENRFEDATIALKTGLQHAKHIGETPSLLQLLVGIALANIQLKRIEDVIQRPESPNFYWALSSLPRPFINPRPGLDGEEAFLKSILPGIQAIESGVVTADQATQAIESLANSLANSTDDRGVRSLTSKVGVVGYAAIYLDQAKKELRERGRTAKDLDSMPATQVVLLRGISIYRELLDEQTKLFSVSYSEATAMKEAGKKRLSVLKEMNDPLISVFTLNVPAFEKVFEAHARTERRIAILRVVEAVRMYAASHGGMPPSKLDEITAVPVPADPNTGKPFAYQLDGKVAHILALPPQGEEANAINSMGYVLTIRK